MAKSSEKSGREVVSVQDDNNEAKWRAESALSDFERVERHRQDPQLMKHVEKLRDQKLEHLAKIKVETAPKTMKKGR